MIDQGIQDIMPSEIDPLDPSVSTVRHNLFLVESAKIAKSTNLPSVNKGRTEQQAHSARMPRIS